MKHLLQEIRQNPLLWLLAPVPGVVAAEQLWHESHTLLFAPDVDLSKQKVGDKVIIRTTELSAITVKKP